MSMNLSSVVGYNLSPLPFSKTCEFHAVDIIKDTCEHLDDKVTMFVLFIFTFYVANNIMVPRILETFRRHSMYDVLVTLTDKYISLNETIALGGSVFIFVIVWLQGMRTGFKVWGITLMGIVVLTMIAEGIRWWRKR